MSRLTRIAQVKNCPKCSRVIKIHQYTLVVLFVLDIVHDLADLVRFEQKFDPPQGLANKKLEQTLNSIGSEGLKYRLELG